MAARRLIVVLVLLLGASVVAAALAPDRTSPVTGGETTTTSTESPQEPAASTGRAVVARLEATASEPETLDAAVGDQIALTVGSDPAQTIAIDAFGLAEFASPEDPARFDLLLREPGAIAITGEDGGVVGRIVAEDPQSGASR